MVDSKGRDFGIVYFTQGVEYNSDMGLGFFTHIVILVFGALVILSALAFVVVDMFGRVDYLKVHFPWLEQILARRSGLVVLLLVAILLLIGDAFELVRKEIPEAIIPPPFVVKSPIAPVIQET